MSVASEPHQGYFHSLKFGLSSFMANFIAGVLHPLDVIKTRLQSHDGKGRLENVVPKYQSSFSAFKDIFKSEGLAGLYKGFFLSLLSHAVASSFFFWMYEMRKRHHLKNNLSKMNAVSRSSLESSIIAVFFTQPFWVIKTRMLLNTHKVGEINNLLHSVHQIYTQSGLVGFSRGLNINLVLASSGVIQLSIYEGAKIIYDQTPIPQSRFSQKNFICGGIAKLFADIFCYPLTTVRTRIQQNPFVGGGNKQKYKGVFDIIRKTGREEGFRGFYKGLAVNITKGIPQKGIYFYCYELIKKQIFHLEEALSS